MPYNSIIDRTNDADALIPTDEARGIIKEVCDSSWLFRLATKLQNMPTNVRTMPVMSALPIAYFVNGDTSLKQTTEVSWESKNITAEELAVIVPVPEAVLSDAEYDIWGEVRPALVDAFNVAINGAVLYGTNIPAAWTTDLGAAGLVAFATAAGHTASIAAFDDIYGATLGETADGAADGLLALIEADGFQATGHVAAVGVKARLRNCRDTDGNPIFVATPQAESSYALDGAPCYFPDDGSIDSSEALLISGDWRKLVYSFRQDITFKFLDQAVIQDAGGNIVYNLAQQDMVALRAVMRLGFALPNPINRMQQTEASRSPFAILTA